MNNTLREKIRLQILQQDIIREDLILAVMETGKRSYLLSQGEILTQDQIDTYFDALERSQP